MRKEPPGARRPSVSPAPLSWWAATPVGQHGRLSVSGHQIVDGHGRAVSLAGLSLFWSNTGWGGDAFYNADAVQWARDDWGVQVVRAAMGVEGDGGYLQDPTNLAKVEAVIQASVRAGIYVIVDWHSHHAEDSQDEAVAFFSHIARRYGHLPNIIYEVYNEPLGGVSWSATVKPYAERVVDAIRAIDPGNLIVVGSPTWSQDVDVASDDPVVGRGNIAYALHFYAESHTASLRAKARAALENGAPLFVTEWGTVNAFARGSVAERSVAAWMEFLAEHKISHCNWSLNDRDETASALVPGADPRGGWSAAQLTESGRVVKRILASWSRTCPPGLASVAAAPADWSGGGAGACARHLAARAAASLCWRPAASDAGAWAGATGPLATWSPGTESPATGAGALSGGRLRGTFGGVHPVTSGPGLRGPR